MTVAGRLRISPESRQAFLGEKEIMLTRKEFDLLLLFAENPNKVFTCDQLYDLLWSEQTAYNVDEVVKAHIKSLRQKLSDDDSVQIKKCLGCRLPILLQQKIKLPNSSRYIPKNPYVLLSLE